MPKIVDHEERRRELVRAAWKLVGEGGLEAVTTRAVAREAGWSTGVLAHYFESRHDLLLAAFRLVAEEVEERMRRRRATEPDPVRRLQIALLECVPIDDQRRTEATVWFAFLGLAAGHPALRDEAQARYAIWLDFLEEAVAEVLSSRDVARGEARRLARLLIAHVDGLTVQALFDPAGLPPRRLKPALEECIRVTLAQTKRSLEP